MLAATTPSLIGEEKSAVGDKAGHKFRGNQWTKGEYRPGSESDAEAQIDNIEKLYAMPEYNQYTARLKAKAKPGEWVTINSGTLPGKVDVMAEPDGLISMRVYSSDGKLLDEKQHLYDKPGRETASGDYMWNVMRAQFGLHKYHGEKEVETKPEDIEQEMRGWVGTPQLTGTGKLETLLTTDTGRAWTKKNLHPVYDNLADKKQFPTFDEWYEKGTIDIFRGEAKQAFERDPGLTYPLRSYTLDEYTAHRFAEGGGSSYHVEGAKKGKAYVVHNFPVRDIIGFWQRDNQWGSEDEVLIYPEDVEHKRRIIKSASWEEDQHPRGKTGEFASKDDDPDDEFEAANRAVVGWPKDKMEDLAAALDGSQGQPDDNVREAYEALRQSQIYKISGGIDALQALQDYSASWYQTMNYKLRSPDDAKDRIEADTLKQVQSRNSLLQTAIMKSQPLGQPLTVYRGFSSVATGNKGTAFQVGQVLRDKGFVSTTLDKGVTAEFSTDADAEIHLSAGQHFLCGQRLGELEFILPHDTKFKVISVEIKKRKPDFPGGDDTFQHVVLEALP